MKLKDVRDFYYINSGKTSDLVRQLGLAGIAVIWIFKSDVHGTPAIPTQLLAPLSLIILGLAFDFLQYVAGTIIWGAFNRTKERKSISQETDFEAPSLINWPALAFFWLKVMSIVVAYGLLLQFIIRNIVLR